MRLGFFRGINRSLVFMPTDYSALSDISYSETAISQRLI